MSPQDGIHVDASEDPDRFFWAACANREFWLQHCRSCQKWQYYPRSICSHCWSRDLVWRRPSGRAVIESFSVVQRGSGAWAASGPYVVAFVTLAEGPRMMTNIEVADPGALEIGMELSLGFKEQNDQVVPIFTTV